MFNSEEFLNQQYEGGLDTFLPPVPEGDYLGETQPVTAESFREFDIKRGDNAGKKGYGLKVMIRLQEERIKEELGRDPLVVYDCFLDRTATGALDRGRGKNVKLGALLEAVGLNDNGRSWTFGMIGNQLVRVKVKNRTDEETGRIYSDAVAVTKAS